MALRVISISKIIFDGGWHELSPEEKTRERGSENFMTVLRATSQESSIKIDIVGNEIPQELVFGMNSILRIGSGMIMYQEYDLNKEKTKSLDLNALDEVFYNYD